MSRLLNCAAIICALLSFCGLRKAETDATNWNLTKNIYVINQFSEVLKTSVEGIKATSEEHMKMLNELKSGYDLVKGDNSACYQIAGHFNATYKKLNEIQEEQIKQIHTILDKQVYLKSCKEKSVSTAMPVTLNEINKKIENFEQILETLERKLQQQQTSQTLNEEQVQLVKAINAKLAANQEKFEKIEEELPNLLEMTKIFKQMASPKNHTFLIDVRSL